MSARRNVPPLDELYALIDSPFPREAIDGLMKGDPETVGRLSHDHLILTETGDGYRLITLSSLRRIAEAVERAIDRESDLMGQLAKAVNHPDEFAEEIRRAQRILDQAVQRAPQVAPEPYDHSRDKEDRRNEPRGFVMRGHYRDGRFIPPYTKGPGGDTAA